MEFITWDDRQPWKCHGHEGFINKNGFVSKLNLINYCSVTALNPFYTLKVTTQMEK